jgi:carboxylesterase 2
VDSQVPNSPNGTQVVIELGNFFGNVHIGKKAQVKFIMDWYHQQTPY